MGLSLPKSNLIFLKKCLDKWVHFITFNVLPISGVRNTDLMNSLHLICLVHGLEVRRPEMVVLWMLVGPTAVGVHA